MSIFTEIDRIQQAKASLKTSLENKGCTVPSSATIDTYPTIVNTIQTFDPYAGHDYVEIGGVKWATMNVGATGMTDYGNYYQYGKGAAQYAATSGESYYDGTENPLAASADTAVQVWGGQWHMPTQTQCEELTANTTYEWTTINGVNGGKFTAQNGNYVFFPAGGADMRDIGNYFFGLTSSPINGANHVFKRFYLASSISIDDGWRTSGCSVRGVVG